ncbi:MAG: hypothetical protein ACOC5T_04575 [Elusimicrobiota bacterium]
MILNVSQVKKIVGNFCTKVTKNADSFRVYFKIGSKNKKSIDRVLKYAKGVNDGDSDYVSGYIEVSDDPSSTFGKNLGTVKEKKPSYKKEKRPSYTKEKDDYLKKDVKTIKTRKSNSYAKVSKDSQLSSSEKSKKSSDNKDKSSKDEDDSKKGFFSRLTGK